MSTVLPATVTQAKDCFHLILPASGKLHLCWAQKLVKHQYQGVPKWHVKLQQSSCSGACLKHWFADATGKSAGRSRCRIGKREDEQSGVLMERQFAEELGCWNSLEGRMLFSLLPESSVRARGILMCQVEFACIPVCRCIVLTWIAKHRLIS